MNNNSRTLKFVIAAAVMVGLAGLTSFMTRPTPVKGFGKVGEPFFEDFKDPNLATALRVVAYNEETASARVFAVENKDGTWRIPSHHNYPADGKDQLAKTASTLIGVTRGALVSRRKSDHERYGVVGPDDAESETLKGRGQQVTLLKGDVTIADLIVGKKLPEGENRYYVRRGDEDDTYISELEVDLSTKFGDWVEADLLKLERDDLVKLEARSTNVEGLEISEVVNASLMREKFSDPWKLDGLNEEAEEINEDAIREMVNVIDNLKLSGIRPKPKLGDKPILRGDLSIGLPKGAAQSPQIVNQIIDMVQSSLQAKGFFVYQNREANDYRLYSKAGELVASTKDGVRYHMSFGNEFEGTEEEIEFGGTEEAADEEEAEGDEQKPADPPGSEAEEESDEEEEAEGTKSRYLFVRASFDESLLGPEPVAPVKPDVPEGVEVDADGNVVKAEEEKAADVEKTAEDASGEKEAEEAKEATDDEKASEKADGEEAKEEAKEEKPDVADIYQRAIEKYRADQTKYESDVEEREKQIEDGQKKVDELNDRFADWYYVITAEDFDKLRLSRDQLVKEKEKPAEEGENGDGAAPAEGTAPILNPAPTEGKPEATSTPEATSKPDDAKDTPASEPAKSEESAAPTDNPADSKAAAPKPEPPAPADKPAEEATSADESKPEAPEKPAAESSN